MQAQTVHRVRTKSGAGFNQVRAPRLLDNGVLGSLYRGCTVPLVSGIPTTLMFDKRMPNKDLHEPCKLTVILTIIRFPA